MTSKIERNQQVIDLLDTKIEKLSKTIYANKLTLTEGITNTIKDWLGDILREGDEVTANNYSISFRRMDEENYSHEIFKLVFEEVENDVQYIIKGLGLNYYSSSVKSGETFGLIRLIDLGRVAAKLQTQIKICEDLSIIFTKEKTDNWPLYKEKWALEREHRELMENNKYLTKLALLEVLETNGMEQSHSKLQIKSNDFSNSIITNVNIYPNTADKKTYKVNYSEIQPGWDTDKNTNQSYYNSSKVVNVSIPRVKKSYLMDFVEKHKDILATAK